MVLALCAAAAVAGMASFTAIAGWVDDVPAELLGKLYDGPTDASSVATIWRVVTGADAAAVDVAIGAWLLAHAAAGHTAVSEATRSRVMQRPFKIVCHERRKEIPM